MDNRERVLASLSHRQPDKIPYDILFTQKSHANGSDRGPAKPVIPGRSREQRGGVI